ncbi:MAG: hypothetical protein MJ218_00495 [Opitutales bacterium]|nr:hypothetical protein [Opitutales bacterium]
MSLENPNVSNLGLQNPVNNPQIQESDKANENQNPVEQQTKCQKIKTAFKTAFKAIGKGIGALVFFGGTTATAMGIASMITSIVAAGITSALCPIIPVVLIGIAAAGLGGLLFTKLGGSMSTLVSLGITAIFQGIAKAKANGGKVDMGNLNDIANNTKNVMVDFTKNELKNQYDNLDPELKQTVDTMIDGGKNIAGAIKNTHSLNDLMALCQNKDFMASMSKLGTEVMQIKKELLPSKSTEPSILTKAFDKLKEAKAQLETLKNNVINSDLGHTLHLEDVEQHLTIAFQNGKLKEDPLGTIKDTLVETGSKILNSAISENANIPTDVFKEIVSNITEGNSEALFNGLANLAKDMVSKSPNDINTYLSSLAGNAKVNIDNILEMYANLKANQPELLENMLNGETNIVSANNIQKMFQGIIENTGKKVYEHILKQCDIPQLIQNIDNFADGKTDDIDIANVQNQLRVLSEALYNMGTWGLIDRRVYLDPKNPILTEELKGNLQTLKNTLTNLSNIKNGNVQAFYSSIITNNNVNEVNKYQDANYLLQYLKEI